MSKKLTKYAAASQRRAELKMDDAEVNFMGGVSYRVDPLLRLKFVAASSIFGEPQYYRAGLKVKDAKYERDAIFGDKDEFSLSFDKYAGKDTSEVFTEIIDEALDFDFYGVVRLASTLRGTYNMRLNPQVIMVRAAIHPKRKEFTEAHPGVFAEIEQLVMRRADEPATQLAYYLFVKGGKAKLPTLLKRAWAKNLAGRDAYEINKYKNSEVGILNTVRVCHANSKVIDELCKTGKVSVAADESTWEALKSAGKTWKEIISTINMGHMALVRNARGIFKEISDPDTLRWYKDAVLGGVKGGKQFPFRYYSAYKAVKDSDANFVPQLMDLFQECMEKSLDNMPKLKGRTMCLSDNSGSAWGEFTSEFGTVTVADIDNLSSVIAARCSDEGYVAKFGDKIKYAPVSKMDGILTQTLRMSEGSTNDIGGGTETGIWLFFEKAIREKDKYDNIFVFSDQQAGTGGLYTTKEDAPKDSQFRTHGTYVNVYACILEYRRKVNPKVNVFSVQTAGYDNCVVPQMAYRTALLTGWTGKEILFASEYIKNWGEAECKSQQKQ